MQGPEFNSIDIESTEKGFSEKKMAKAREGRLADNSQVKKPTNSSQIKKRKPLTVLKQLVVKQLVRRNKMQALSKDPQDLVK